MQLEQDTRTKVTPTFLDKVVGYVAPERGCKRMRARAAWEDAKKRGYGGASKSSRLKDWLTGGGSANDEISIDGETQRNRARALVRDEGYMCAAIDTLEEKVIGTGLKLQIAGNGFDRFKEEWERWSGTTECDSEGVLTLGGMAGMAVRGNVEAGEIVARKRPRRTSDGLTVPMQVQMLEADFIDSSKDDPNRDGGGKIIQGVHFNGLGKRVGLQLFKEHPGESIATANFESKFHPMDELAHVFKMKRPGQARGVTQMHALITLMHQYDGFKDARLTQAFVAACFTAVLHTDEVEGEIEAHDDFESTKITPGTMVRAPDGTTGVSFPNPPSHQDAAGQEMSILRTAAKCMWMTYEELTGDYSGVNYSSGRMGHIAVEGLRRSYRKNVLIPLFYDRVLGWFREAYYLKTGDATKGLRWSWAQPRREMVDPNKETEAKSMAIRGGLKSWQETVREDGGDPDLVVQQMKEDKAAFEAAGLTVPWEQPEKEAAPKKEEKEEPSAKAKKKESPKKK